jgi:uncharacterized membrane protein YozB (DUF420 family)
MQPSAKPAGDRGLARRRGTWIVLILLAALVLLFGALRFVIDLPFIASRTLPDPESFEFRYVVVPWLAYGHIVPALVFLAIAPFQLWRGFRQRHWTAHRRMGRVAVVCGIVAGIFGTLFGTVLAFGGTAEAVAAAVFGAYFLAAVSLAYRSIRRKDVRSHRRWMIRAASIALAAGTIRLWVGLFALIGIDFTDAFAAAFWLGFGAHAIVAEGWLAWRPEVTGFARARRRPTDGPTPARPVGSQPSAPQR